MGALLRSITSGVLLGDTPWLFATICVAASARLSRLGIPNVGGLTFGIAVPHLLGCRSDNYPFNYISDSYPFNRLSDNYQFWYAGRPAGANFQKTLGVGIEI